MSINFLTKQGKAFIRWVKGFVKYCCAWVWRWMSLKSFAYLASSFIFLLPIIFNYIQLARNFICSLSLIKTHVVACVSDEQNDNIENKVTEIREIDLQTATAVDSIVRNSEKICVLDDKYWRISRGSPDVLLTGADLNVNTYDNVTLSYKHYLPAKSTYHIIIKSTDSRPTYIFSFKSLQNGNELEVILNTKENLYDLRYNKRSVLKKADKIPIDRFGSKDIELSVVFSYLARGMQMDVSSSFAYDDNRPVVPMYNYLTGNYGKDVVLTFTAINDGTRKDFLVNFPSCSIS